MVTGDLRGKVTDDHSTEPVWVVSTTYRKGSWGKHPLGSTVAIAPLWRHRASGRC